MLTSMIAVAGSKGIRREGYSASGDVESQCQFVWRPRLVERNLQGGPRAGDRVFMRWPIAERADAWAKPGRGAPATVLILLDILLDATRQGNDRSHDIDCRVSIRGMTLSHFRWRPHRLGRGPGDRQDRP